MIQLTPDECRVLGVLIEKAQTTPNQYPLTLNAVSDGSRQKNNRNPVMEFDQDRALDAVNGLRSKGLIVQTESAGSRTPKYRHEVTAKLGVSMRELVILAEMLLRGPQTSGELRGRASRMHSLETLEVVSSTLEQMMAREEPLVGRLPPVPGSRAERYAQLLCPDAHPLHETASGVEGVAPALTPAAAPSLAERVARLETQVGALQQQLRRLADALGEPLAENAGEGDRERGPQ